MSYQDFFTTQDPTSIQAFYDYVQCNFHFGWMDQRGNYHHEANTANNLPTETYFIFYDD